LGVTDRVKMMANPHTPHTSYFRKSAYAVFGKRESPAAALVVRAS
jgi:hypothetical protein